MESYGELLKKTRENKKIEIDKITRETTITRQYIEALESEDIDVFPGEAYFIGFLKNYCEYLQISSDDVLKLYYAKKIQMEPVPVQLLERKPNKAIPYIIAGSIAAFIIGLFFILYFVVFNVPSKRAEKKESENDSQKIHQYTFTGKPENKRLYRGDQILVQDASGDKTIVLTVSQTLGYFSIETPAGEQIVELSEEREIDVNGDGKAELIVYLSDVSSLEASYGAEVRIMQKTVDSAQKPAASSATAATTPTETSNITAASSSSKYTVIHEDTRPYPFVINVTFRGSCLFRYKIDNYPYVEDYYKSGDNINISATKSGFRLWMSNVNALKIQVIATNSTYDLEVGRGGQVVVEDIKWVYDKNDGKYRIVLEDVN